MNYDDAARLLNRVGYAVIGNEVRCDGLHVGDVWQIPGGFEACTVGGEPFWFNTREQATAWLLLETSPTAMAEFVRMGSPDV